MGWKKTLVYRSKDNDDWDQAKKSRYTPLKYYSHKTDRSYVSRLYHTMIIDKLVTLIFRNVSRATTKNDRGTRTFSCHFSHKCGKAYFMPFS